MTWFLLEASEVPLQKILLSALILIAFVVAGLVVIAQVKKRLKASDGEGESTGFMLSDLRALHKKGEISTEEFELAKARVIAAARRSADREESAEPENRGQSSRDV